ncbi:hypothetical protein FQR65_LT11896 [Abscondita terminalis]|nr:hypothetical protein FQR65_LT11896 [Abscondita terminalis]
MPIFIKVAVQVYYKKHGCRTVRHVLVSFENEPLDVRSSLICMDLRSSTCPKFRYCPKLKSMLVLTNKKPAKFITDVLPVSLPNNWMPESTFKSHKKIMLILLHN